MSPFVSGGRRPLRFVTPSKLTIGAGIERPPKTFWRAPSFEGAGSMPGVSSASLPPRSSSTVLLPYHRGTPGGIVRSGGERCGRATPCDRASLVDEARARAGSGDTCRGPATLGDALSDDASVRLPAPKAPTATTSSSRAREILILSPWR